MNSQRLHILPLMFVAFVIATILGSCRNGANDMVISEDEMEDVLYDYHIVDGIIRTSSLDSVTTKSYIESVFNKHGITRAEFDSSMIYYMRHADIMEGIYKRIYTRIENEGRLRGVNGANFNAVSTDANSDTANIWNQEKVFVMTEHVPFNNVGFSFKADSTFKKGDKFVLKFNSDFIIQEGTRNGYAIFTMVLNNDSAITRTTSLTSQMERSLEVEDFKREGIKEVKGYFIHRISGIEHERNSSTMKFMIISNVQLIKMHTPEPVKQDSIQSNKTDSISNEKKNSTMPEPPVNGKLRQPGLH